MLSYSEISPFSLSCCSDSIRVVYFPRARNNGADTLARIGASQECASLCSLEYEITHFVTCLVAANLCSSSLK